ncbi:hypothetical protein FZC66_04840 [Priestia megaterium]|nr:hypothetical protein FZC66_04840 [Priestia megaterium]
MFSIHHIKNTVPTFVVDAPGGGGKISLQPNYLISQSADKVVLRNFEGVITTYPEPENYVPGRADDYFASIYPNASQKDSVIGIAGLMNDTQSNLIPEGLGRVSRRRKYEANVNHTSLKDKREKRDELKEKKFKAQLKKENDSASS